MRSIAHLADPSDAIAYVAFHVLVEPALRDVACGPLSRARHSGRVCWGPGAGDLCADCTESIHDLLLDGFTRLRVALVGPLPLTASGEPVRELAVLCDHIISVQARWDDARQAGELLRGRPAEDEPAWVRAARAQLVHYPVRHLEALTRRNDATRRGAAARPDRDLRTAGWAAPLREDPAEQDLLVFAVFRARRGPGELGPVPTDLCERHGLDQAEARRRLHEALARLRRVSPAFFAANVGDLVAEVPEKCTDNDPQWLVLDADARDRARSAVARLVSVRPDEPEPRRHRRAVYREVIAVVCAVGLGGTGDPVDAAVRAFRLEPLSARRLVRRLVSLACTAGLDWTFDLVSGPEPTAGSVR